ncbi:TrkA family potassium uptake protein [Solimonas sp. SE-A11]|uniref:potassium channel family protein n=1 Tax=Solimonas sp. SE-A11 TaxID=3054954 RepID=UPI00259C8F50|nr:potassium channel family protein [Solimonas sp. SE-A11]MDM4773004.1 potassium channel family protein [Solimonas sp. SE-A11]
MRESVPPERVLLSRVLLLVALVSIILAVFWWDRDGLKDHVDGEISFSDVAYFTAVTVTTVGYGDIVPVSDRARIVDALLVTPLRLVIWLVFLGTAYELVLQRWLENRRMTRIQQSLKQHLIVCGYGHSGQSAAQEAVARGTPPDQILVMERDEVRLRLAASCGYIGLLSDPTRENDLLDAGVANAQAVLVCLGRDDAAVLTVLTVRQLNPKVRVICSVAEEENIKLLRQAGTDAVVAPSMVGGFLMADSVQSSHIADYVSDLMRIGGRIHLLERMATPAEIGRTMRELEPGLVVRLIRGGERIGFWEGERARVQPQDILLVIQPNLDG